MKWIYVLAATVLASCSHSGFDDSSGDAAHADSHLMQQGMMSLDAGDYERAFELFDKALRQQTVTAETPQLYYYSGLALNGLQRFSDAESRFRSSMKLAQNYDSYLEVESLFQLALVYEAEGDTTKSLATLVDVEHRKNFLHSEVANIELPARIASLYSQQGEVSTAEKFYALAEKGLDELVKKNPEGRQTWLPRVLFEIGRVSPRNIQKSDFDSQLRSFRRAQRYLLKAVLYNAPNWSPRASHELKVIYESAWKLIESTPLDETQDKLLALKKQQDAMIDMGLQLQGTINELKRWWPPTDDTKAIGELKQFVADYAKRLDALVAARPVHERLTPEAEKLQPDVSGGEVVDPSGELEKKKGSK